MTLNEQAPAAVAQKAQTAGGHWYGFEPERRWYPLYQPGKTFTLREARLMRAEGKVVVPSVTTIFRVLHKQTLMDWLIDQHLNVALRTNRAEFDSDEQWKEHVSNVASNSSKGAMDLGTRIHAATEFAIADKDYEADMDIYVQAVLAARAKLGITSIEVEACCGSIEHGYGGRCDEQSHPMTISDIKSRKSRGKKVPSYATDVAQLAAYGVALFGPDFLTKGRGVVFAVSTNEPGLVTVHEYKEDALTAAWNAFLGMIKIWRWENKWL